MSLSLPPPAVIRRGRPRGGSYKPVSTVCPPLQIPLALIRALPSLPFRSSHPPLSTPRRTRLRHSLPFHSPPPPPPLYTPKTIPLYLPYSTHAGRGCLTLLLLRRKGLRNVDKPRETTRRGYRRCIRSKSRV